MTGPRSGIARVLLLIGGLAAAFAWWGFAAQQTILDPGATRDATVGLLSAKPVQDSAITSLADQLVGMIPRSGAAARLTAAQQRTLSHNAAVHALQDPALRQAFANAIASLQQQLLDGNASQHGLTIDAAAVTSAVRDAVARVDPSVAAQMPHTPLRLHFDTARLPNLHGVDSHTGTITLLAALLALAAWFGAVLLHPQPWTATRVIGRRLIMIGALPLVFWVLIPAGLRAMHFTVAEVLSPLASAYGRRLAPAAIAVTGIGAGLWVAARVAGIAGRNPSRASGSLAPAMATAGSGSVTYTRAGTTERLDRVDMRA